MVVERRDTSRNPEEQRVRTWPFKSITASQPAMHYHIWNNSITGILQERAGGIELNYIQLLNQGQLVGGADSISHQTGKIDTR